MTYPNGETVSSKTSVKSGSQKSFAPGADTKKETPHEEHSGFDVSEALAGALSFSNLKTAMDEVSSSLASLRKSATDLVKRRPLAILLGVGLCGAAIGVTLAVRKNRFPETKGEE